MISFNFPMSSLISSGIKPLSLLHSRRELMNHQCDHSVLDICSYRVIPTWKSWLSISLGDALYEHPSCGHYNQTENKRCEDLHCVLDKCFILEEMVKALLYLASTRMFTVNMIGIHLELQWNRDWDREWEKCLIENYMKFSHYRGRGTGDRTGTNGVPSHLCTVPGPLDGTLYSNLNVSCSWSHSHCRYENFSTIGSSSFPAQVLCK